MSRSLSPRLRAALGTLLAVILAVILLVPATPATAAETITLRGQVWLGSEARPAAAGEVEVLVTHPTETGLVRARTTTAADGSFTLAGVAAGNAQVRFAYTGAEDFPTAAYRGPACGDVCPTLSLTADTTLDFVVPLGRGPHGVVTDATTGVPVAGVDVQLQGPYSGDWWNVQTVATGADGAYRFSKVADGQYRIVVKDPAGVYATQAYPDAAPAIAQQPTIDMRNGATPPAADIALRHGGTIVIQPKVLGIATATTEFAFEISRRDGDSLRIALEGIKATASKPFVTTGWYPGTYVVRGVGSVGNLAPDGDVIVQVAEGATVSGRVTFRTSENSPNRDFNGDGIPDVLAISGTGALLLYKGTASRTLTSGGTIGIGWGAFNHVFAVGDFSGDGLPDVMARDRNGYLFLYRGNGRGGWLGGSKIGAGWQGFTSIVSPGDFNGDRRNDVIAMDGSGRLFLYPGNGASGFGKASQIGTGWSIFKTLIGAGDMDGYLNPNRDLVAVNRGFKNLSLRNSAGVFGPATYTCPNNSDLTLYFGNGTGGFGRSASGYLSQTIGSGWCRFSAVIAGGDLVLIARDASGNLWRYARSFSGSWTPAQRIGIGWGSLRLVG